MTGDIDLNTTQNDSTQEAPSIAQDAFSTTTTFGDKDELEHEETRQGAEAAQQDAGAHKADALKASEPATESESSAEDTHALALVDEAEVKAVAESEAEQQLDRYFAQINRVFVNHQQQLAISRNDNELLEAELNHIKSQYESRIANLERQNRDHIDIITAELDVLKGENKRLSHDIAAKDIENALLAKNFQLQEDNLSHVKKELAEMGSFEDAKQQIEDLAKERQQLAGTVGRLEAELKEAHTVREALQKDLDDEADQKNALISRFRAEIATLEEKHNIQLERQALDMEKKLFDQQQSTATPAASPEA